MIPPPSFTFNYSHRSDPHPYQPSPHHLAITRNHKPHPMVVNVNLLGYASGTGSAPSATSSPSEPHGDGARDLCFLLRLEQWLEKGLYRQRVTWIMTPEPRLWTKSGLRQGPECASRKGCCKGCRWGWYDTGEHCRER
ncbi:zinc carboxypeptidase [Sesbania bispinosa]|nr:zinc carboxypeptidase [Sesbania bispinosa]